MDEKIREIEEIKGYMKEIESERIWLNGNVTNTEYIKLKILLSHISTLEQQIQDIRNDPNHWDRKYEKFLLDKVTTLEERVKLTQEHNDRLGEIITDQTVKRIELAQRVKELDEINIKSFMTTEGVLDNLNKAKLRINELESDLKFNASMLTKQCDLAWEAESRIKELEHSLFELNGKYAARIKELYEAQKIKKLMMDMVNGE